MYLPIVLLPLFTWLLHHYIGWAQRRQVLDQPNLRSSHTLPTVRGGGIIFPVAWLCFEVWNGFPSPWVTLGLLLIAGVSFLDDLRPLGSTLRFLTQMLGFAFLYQQLGLWGSFSSSWLIVVLVFSVGLINVVNFMDGINGITGFYGLVFFGSVYLINSPVPFFSPANPTLFMVLGLAAFGYFNFRKRARCFAGDIGSTSLGFLMIYFLISLVFQQPSKESLGVFRWEYLFLVAIYGIDGILTIFQRLFQGENILQPHRKHLYQLLANEFQWPHLWVSAIYAGLQLGLNLLILGFPQHPFTVLWATLLLGALYLPLKYYLFQRSSRPATSRL